MKGAAIKYTAEQLAFIQANCSMMRKALAEAVNAKFGTAYSVENIKSLCTRKGWKTGRDGRFYAGQPYNPNSGGKGPNKTSFKKGHRPKNWHPVGHERLMDGYLLRKIADTGCTRRDYVEVHRMLWEEHHGIKVPEGHIITFVDGNKQNITIDNLLLISRAEHAVINKRGLRNLPPEAKRAGITLGRLIHKTNQAQKQ